jgi:hypothetical protein
MIRSLFALGLTALSLLGAAEAHAETRKFCVYDPAGRSGDQSVEFIVADHRIPVGRLDAQIEQG